MARKLGLLAFLLLLLAVAAVIVRQTARPSARGRNPLADVQPEAISRVIVENRAGRVVLERADGSWNVAEPFSDAASPQQVGRMVSALRDFAVSSVVSENPGRHEQFEVNEGSATRIQVFVTGKEKPALDGYIGKTVTGADTVYFRFAGQQPVRLGRNLPKWMFEREPREFREPRVLPVPSTAAVSVRVEGSGVNVHAVRSTDTWTLAGSTVSLSGETVSSLLSALDGWYARDFFPQAPADPGFNEPVLMVSIETPEANAVATVGRTVPAGGARFANTKGRETVMSIGEESVDEVLAKATALAGASLDPSD